MRVIMFDIDTLRADHMGCYGYGRDTTPVLLSQCALPAFPGIADFRAVRHP